MESEVKYLYLDDIIPNRFQPRENFDERALKELAVSIKEHGVIQPIIVRQIGEKYEIIAGERRYKASAMVGLSKIPAIITNLDDKESSKVALIENLQRKDLTPIEEARTYQKILELDSLTQEELAKTMGKSQSAVSNKLRLLSLADEVQDALLHEQISERHARSLLNVEDKNKQVELLNKVISTRMTVRELDEEIKNMISPNEKTNESILNTNVNENINPTVVDVNQIKNNAEDIAPTPSNVNINDLLKPQEPQVEMNNHINDFNNNLIGGETKKPSIEVLGNEDLLTNIPTINNNSNASLNDIPQTSHDNNSLYQNLGSDIHPTDIKNVINDENAQVNVPNNLFNTNTSTSTENATKTAVNKIKETIESIKTTGKKVEMEEYDFEDFYQIVLRIDK